MDFEQVKDKVGQRVHDSVSWLGGGEDVSVISGILAWKFVGVLPYILVALGLIVLLSGCVNTEDYTDCHRLFVREYKSGGVEKITKRAFLNRAEATAFLKELKYTGEVQYMKLSWGRCAKSEFK